MYSDSKFKIRIDFDKSHDSYIYDRNRKRYFLDFFGLYSSLPLGYNHKIFDDKNFQETYNRIAKVKIPNCEVITDEAQEFFREFSSCDGMKIFKNFHFCCTGALAVETAIRAAVDQKKRKSPQIISLKESFHGIKGYGAFATDLFPPVDQRLKGFPAVSWPKVHNPKIIYRNNRPDIKATEEGLEKFRMEFNRCLKRYGSNITALIIEPIQSTCGDNYFPKNFFTLVRNLCDKHNICLIFDEIQTGFGTTGKMWYLQHLNVEPDIVIFGKKTQVSGVMAKEKFGKIFKTPVKIEDTFDGDLVDMVRCRYILKAYKKYHILKNVQERGEQLLFELKKINFLKNVRGQGLLVAFDLATPEEQEQFAKKAFKNGLMFNKTRDKTIRLRPNLNVSSKETQEAIKVIKKSLS